MNPKNKQANNSWTKVHTQLHTWIYFNEAFSTLVSNTLNYITNKSSFKLEVP